MLQEEIAHQEHLAGIPRQVVLMDFQKAFLRTADEQVLARWYLKNVTRKDKANGREFVFDLGASLVDEAEHVVTCTIQSGYCLLPLGLQTIKDSGWHC